MTLFCFNQGTITKNCRAKEGFTCTNSSLKKNKDQAANEIFKMSHTQTEIHPTVAEYNPGTIIDVDFWCRNQSISLQLQLFYYSLPIIPFSHTHAQ